MSETTPEAWWIFTEGTKHGFIATTHSSQGRKAMKVENHEGQGVRSPLEIWRPTERWAWRVCRRKLIRFLREEKAEEERAARVRKYAVKL